MKESSNLESISWYLYRLSNRAAESDLPNAEEFRVAALMAKESLDQLICILKDSLNADKTFEGSSE